MKKFTTLVIALGLITILNGTCDKAQVPSSSPIEFEPYPIPVWLNEYQLFVYGSPRTDYLRELGATVTTWGIFFTGVNDSEKTYIEDLRLEGFRVFSNFSTMQGYEYFDPEEGIEERSACLTLSGEKATFFWSIEEPKPWVPCNNNPEWSDLLNRRMKEHLRAGVNGVHMDEIEGIAGFLFVAGFCPYCMTGFRHHLYRKFPDSDVIFNKFGIEDIETFDYGAYLRGIGKTLKEDPNKDLRREFILFQLMSRRRHIESMVHLVKKEGGTDIAVSANTTFLSPHKQIFMPALDLAVYEMFMTPPPQGRYLAMHFWARGIDPAKRFVIFPVSTDMVGFTMEDWPVIAFWMLEALAGGQSFLVPFEAYTGYGPRFTVPSEPLAPVGAFLKYFAGRFPQPQPITGVGILYNLASGLDQYIEEGFAMPISPVKTDQSLNGIGRALQEAHIPYGVIYVGDGQFIKKIPSLNELLLYSVIILPEVPMLSDEVKQLLDEYNAGGGSIVDIGNLGAKYEQEHNSTVRDQIVDSVRTALRSPSVISNAGPEIAIVPWQTGESIIIHFLNYNYNDSMRSFDEVKGVETWLKLPPGFKPEGRSLTIESPWNTGNTLPFRIVDEGLIFTAPLLSNYALVIFE